jgi:hypothetical protein
MIEAWKLGVKTLYYQRSISLFYLLIIKGNIMKKNLLLVGALVSAFLLASCSGGDKSKAPVVSTADIENAAEVIKYYNTSLGVLKDMVKEKDVNAVLDYMEQKGKAPALSAIVPPAVVSKDSAIVLNPGNCFNEETRQNLKQNYTGLFQARTEFYANFDTYLSYLKKKKHYPDSWHRP